VDQVERSPHLAENRVLQERDNWTTVLVAFFLQGSVLRSFAGIQITDLQNVDIQIVDIILCAYQKPI
jgi:hypothetical protein